MILDKIIDTIIRGVNGGKNVQGNIIDPKFVSQSLLPYRAEIAYRNIKRDKRLNNIWYQRYHLIYQPLLQASAPPGTVVFPVPAYIQLDTFDGVQYCGSKDMCNGWIRVKSVQQYSNLLTNKITNPKNNPELTYFMLDMSNRWVVVFNVPTVREGTIYGVQADPLEEPLPGYMGEYNKAKDNYPIDEGDLVELIELLKRDMGFMKAFKPAIAYDNPEGQAENPFPKAQQQAPPQ